MPLDQQKTPYIVDVTLTYVLSINHFVSIDTAAFNTHCTMINSDL